ncbi:MAG: F420-dependent methylenetetrahydromethanopterin dehydrogenase [Candidatus Thorarchaeota archaeon]|nr:F420-dependent methylenetetrahydromethanopterin dehydrogenase [Candidatus Thorarchaeota archaeon]
MNFNLAVIKIGCIASSPLLELIFDERAERSDFHVRVFSSGAKMDPESCIKATEVWGEFKPDLAIIVSPNASLSGPSETRVKLCDIGIPVISISDAPSKKAWQTKDESGKQVTQVNKNEGFIIVPSDSMIGARAEFLDPTEMALFNADAIKVLSVCGIIRALQEIIGDVIDDIEKGNDQRLPTITLTSELAVQYAKFNNPYAKAKAFAALTIAESVASITAKACFKTEKSDDYIPMVAAGHEMMRSAAKLADEAREIEKSQDTVYRTPHSSDGRIKGKERLLEKPK